MSEPRNWLIFDRISECYWGPNGGGYFKSIASAGLFTEKEARAAEDFSNRYKRGEVARPLSEYREAIDRLFAAVHAPVPHNGSDRCISACRQKDILGIRHGWCAVCVAEWRQTAREERETLLDAIDGLRIGDCWCDTGDGNPHTAACLRMGGLMADEHR